MPPQGPTESPGWKSLPESDIVTATYLGQVCSCQQLPSLSRDAQFFLEARLPASCPGAPFRAPPHPKMLTWDSTGTVAVFL